MLKKRIIPCLDVKAGQVVKGVKFQNHRIVGDAWELAQYYCEAGADELVFYDITASSDGRAVDCAWITRLAKTLDIPFCVAGGIRTIEQGRQVLQAGADKISINSPALESPQLINQMAQVFGSQCVVVGVDSCYEDEDYWVYQYTGDVAKTRATKRRTVDWLLEVQDRGAGEVVLNCMNQDGVRQGYDIAQCQMMKSLLHIPLIASGGAGCEEDFAQVFEQSAVEGALAASVFHDNILKINELKQFLQQRNIGVRQ